MSTKLALVDMQAGVAKTQLVAALHNLGIETSEQTTAPMIIFSDGKPLQVDAPVIQLWPGTRTQRQTNPFADPSVRCLLGTQPEIDRQAVAAVVGQIARQNRLLFLEDLVSPNADVHEFLGQRSDEKSGIIAQADRLLEAANAHPFIRDNLSTVLDELYTNAIYNAPCANGEHFYAARNRSDKIVSPRPVRVRIAIDETFAALAVADSYGSLPPQTVVNCLSRCHQGEKVAPEDKAGGAGLGFFMLLQNATHLVINIVPGELTEIIVLRRLGERRRAFMASAPTLSLCVAQPCRQARRQHEREVVNFKASYSFAGSHGTGRIRDISPGGGFLQTQDNARLNVGDPIVVTLYSPEGAPIRVNCNTRWIGYSQAHRCHGLGIRYESSAPDPTLFRKTPPEGNYAVQ
ncbi:MAG: hypothetical protein A2341_25600 [Deltaproteobacteria bacterium RIFOXYB12_FULL_58_9]|nr:MAG: hypothetical protein A2341_25600 [Deltaproteobacteria bacterium RIFOXYB12_FULL_58_9]